MCVPLFPFTYTQLLQVLCDQTNKKGSNKTCVKLLGISKEISEMAHQFIKCYLNVNN